MVSTPIMLAAVMATLAALSWKVTPTPQSVWQEAEEDEPPAVLTIDAWLVQVDEPNPLMFPDGTMVDETQDGPRIFPDENPRRPKRGCLMQRVLHHPYEIPPEFRR